MAADVAAILTPREVSAKIFEGAAQLAEYEKRIEALAKDLKEVTDDRNKLARETLPRLFDHLHTDHLGVPGWAADVVLVNNIHAAIKEDMEEADKTAAFNYLELVGGGGIVKNTVSVQFGLKETELAADFIRYISGWNALAGREVRSKREVHWATLTKFVKEQLKANKPIKLGLLGGSATRECSIKWRKNG
jgi:hypothetical protein